jgi:aquaporin Z
MTTLTHREATGLFRALRAHWPEYLIEAWALGMFMVSAGVITTLLERPGSLAQEWLPNADARRVLIGVAMGLTAIALIHSPWGRRSGAHMNPAVTLTYLRLGHVTRSDSFFYVLAQIAGGTLGVVLVLAMFGDAFAAPPVNYVTTVPGDAGHGIAFAAELIISFVMMIVILIVSNSRRYMRYTGFCAGALVAVYISVEAPLSGMSMNPARSLASGWPGGIWTGFWIYLLAPLAGMQLAASAYLILRGRASVRCAKLLHTRDQRCIHCGHDPARASVDATAVAHSGARS